MFSDSITKYHVSNATLFVYVKGAERRPLPDVLIEVFKVYKAPDHPDSPGLYRMVSKKVTQPLGRGDWVKLDLTITVSEWFKNPRENFGFVVNATANGKKVVVTDTTVEDGSKVRWLDAQILRHIFNPFELFAIGLRGFCCLECVFEHFFQVMVMSDVHKISD
jgi:hypothetical protein